MLHKDILTLLLPVSWIMTDNERIVYGAALDRMKARYDSIPLEMFPATAVELLPEWERLYRIVPPPAVSLDSRQKAAGFACRATGDIKKPYFITLAATLGYTIRINDYREPVIGYYAIGDELDYEPWQDFSAAVSGAGDSLGMGATPQILPACWLVVVLAVPAVPPTPNLEAVLNDLKPAHIHLNFIYP